MQLLARNPVASAARAGNVANAVATVANAASAHPAPSKARKPLRPQAQVILWTPLRWPHGWETNPHQNPRLGGTKPSQFEADRRRAIVALEGMATADPHSLETAHGLFGIMSAPDWHRWAFKHTDNHLRQFGV